MHRFSGNGSGGTCLPGAAVATAGLAVLGHATSTNLGWFAVCLIGVWCALTGGRRDALVYWAGTLILFAVEWLWIHADPGWAAWMAGITLSVAAGLLIRRERDLVAQLREAQAGLADRARSEERNRIARELHDVIAHTLTVSLVDDQELVRTGLRGILRTEFGFDVVGECADGSEVIAAVDSLTPDIVLMDVRMPMVDCVRATRALRGRGGSPPVLALTTFDDDEALAGVLRAGASGFILKGVPAKDLQQAVRVVAEGGAWLDPAVTGRVLAIYRTAAPAAAGSDARLDALTGREREV